MSEKPNYIIYAPAYNPDNGGAIVLHKLCHTLNMLGEKAYFWPTKKKKTGLRSALRIKPYATCKDFNTPIASNKHLDNSIVLYPEITTGNPLGGKNVVRWLLHRPGFHSGVIDYGDNDLFFLFDDSCDDPKINKTPGNILTLFTLNPAYKDNQTSKRSGSCYMMRKGEGRPLVHDMENSIKIDGLSHSEIAKIFNERRIFYCYDELTMYSQFAALCGCISVVIPHTYQNREEWTQLHPISKYGIAYGMNDIEHSINTRHLVRQYFEKKEQESIQAVKAFIQKTYQHFGFNQHA